MNDNEINEAVAKRLGWKPVEGVKVIKDSIGVQAWINPVGETMYIRDFCHSIEAAWKVVEWFYYHEWGFRINRAQEPNIGYSVDVWHVTSGQGGGTIEYGDDIQAVYANEAPMAICKAFLKLPEVK